MPIENNGTITEVTDYEPVLSAESSCRLAGLLASRWCALKKEPYHLMGKMSQYRYEMPSNTLLASGSDIVQELSIGISSASHSRQNAINDCLSLLATVQGEYEQKHALDYTFECSSNFFPEGYTIDHEWGPSLFIYSRTTVEDGSEYYVIHFVQTPRHWRWISLKFTGKIPESHWARSIIPSGINGRMVEMSDEARQKIQEVIQALPPDENDAELTIDLDISVSPSGTMKPSYTIITELSARISPHDPYDDIYAVEELGCQKFSEKQVITRKRYWFNSCTVIVDSKRCFHRLFPSPTCRSQGSYERFLYELRVLTAVPGSKCIMNLSGVVLDDNERHVKGYLLTSPSPNTKDITDEISPRTPWARRERWARYIVESVAQLHSRGFSVGLLDLSCYILDSNDLPQMFLPNAAKYRCLNADGEVPPEHRKGLRHRDEWVELKSTIAADLFRLGMILWLLGNSEPVPVSSRFCQHEECDFVPRSRCTAEHVNPVNLPPCDDPDVPAYYQGVIAKCRSRIPRNRKPAYSLLKDFPSAEILRKNAEKALRRQSQHTEDTYPPGFSMWCDEGGEPIADGSYRCDKCNSGNFDLCVACASRGVHCRDDSHTLYWEEYQEGHLVRTGRRLPLLPRVP